MDVNHNPNLHHAETAVHEDIRIEISGSSGAGQSILLLLIAHCLTEAGFNPHCEDNGRVIELPSDFLSRWNEHLQGEAPTPVRVVLATCSPQE
ncbi:hypothetical protein D9M71_633550 [compost metagenome]